MKYLFFGSAAVLALVVVGPASAADKPSRAPVYKAAPAMVSVYNWTGFYVGGNVGYSWGRSSSDWNFYTPSMTAAFPECGPAGAAFCSTGSDSSKLNGAIGGLQAGYNWQMGSFLAGIETDIQISGQRSSGTFTSTFLVTTSVPPGIVSAAHSEKLLWLGTLRGRAGITFDRWLVYGSGGLAFGQVKFEGTATATGVPGGGPPLICLVASGCPFVPFGGWSDTHTKAGWAVGAGIEGVVSNNWTVKIEYLYVDLGNVDTTFATPPGCYGNGTALQSACVPVGQGTGTIHNKVTDNIVRAGLNYKFDWGKAPVAARY